MLPDLFIDELIRLQTRYSNLIWRLWEEDGVNIEFFLEELAFDCSRVLRIAGIATEYHLSLPRVVHIHIHDIQKDERDVMNTLWSFFEKDIVKMGGCKENPNLQSQEE